MTAPYEEGRRQFGDCAVRRRTGVAEPGTGWTFDTALRWGVVFSVPREVGNNDSGVLSAAGLAPALASLSLADGARRTGLFVTEFHSLAAAAGLDLQRDQL